MPDKKQKNPFPYSSDNKRYHTLTYHYQKRFGGKVAKASLNAGFSCPNLDGTKGYGGCIYCSKSGSGEFAGEKTLPPLMQFEQMKNRMMKKWEDAKWIAYFQARSNTYAPVSFLKKIYEPFLEKEDVLGIAIATRPDTLSEECLSYLKEMNQRTFLTVELGLQTIHDKTAKYINRCCSLEEFEKAVLELRKRNIEVVVHIINGLPYETKEQMLQTVSYLNQLDIQGIKIHMLHILKDTPLATRYEKEKFKVLTKEEYVDIVISQLERLRPEIVIHRITGDPKKEDLIAPDWLLKKFCVLNEIDKEMVKRNTYQGKQLSTKL